MKSNEAVNMPRGVTGGASAWSDVDVQITRCKGMVDWFKVVLGGVESMIRDTADMYVELNKGLSKSFKSSRELVGKLEFDPVYMERRRFAQERSRRNVERLKKEGRCR